MKNVIQFSRFGALGIALFLLVANRGYAEPQTTNDVPAAKADDLLQAELLKSYVHLQEQLHAAQLAIEQNRQEYQESARAQVAAMTDKLNAIQSALDAERQRQQEEMQRSNRTLLGVASAFGGLGLLAMLFTAVFQWRTMSRLADMTTTHTQLVARLPQGLLAAEAEGQATSAVELSNQRLMAVIDRLERRVYELEHTAAKPLPAGGPGVVEAETPAPDEPADGVAGRIAALLNRGQTLLNADQVEEALAAYEEALKLDANHPETLVKKGAALERLKQDDEALRCYDRAIAADGKLTIAYLYKGGIYNRLERYNEALECYEQALKVQGGAA